MCKVRGHSESLKSAKIALVMLALLAALWLSDSIGLSPGQAVTGYVTLKPPAISIPLYRGANYVAVMPDMVGKTGSEIATSSSCGSFDYFGTLEGQSYMSNKIPLSMLGRAIRINIPTKRKGGLFGLFGSWDYSIKCYYKEPEKEHEQPPIEITSGSIIGITAALTAPDSVGRAFKDYGCDLISASIYYRNSESKTPFTKETTTTSDLPESFIGMAMRVELAGQCTLYGEKVQGKDEQPQPTPSPTPPDTTGTQPDTTTPTPTPVSPTSPPAAQECVDSDKGKKYYEDGIVTVGIGLLPDECFSEYSLLIEYFCNAENEADFEAFTCQYGCSPSGKSCEPPKQAQECVDSDKGKKYYEDGVVTISIGLLPDKCSSKSNLLTEYFCNADGTFNSEVVACQNGCSPGGKSCEQYALPFIGGRKSVIAVSEDMVGKKIDNGIFDQCDVEFAQYYDATKSNLPFEDRWDVLYAKKGPSPSQALTKGMVGHGLSIVLEPPYTSCELKTKGYTDSLGAAASLIKGYNLIAVPKSMTANAKSFNDVKGDCAIESVQLYDKSQDKDIEITAAFKFGPTHLGKAAWVKVTNNCALDDLEKQKEEAKTAAEAECSDTEGDGVKDPYKEGTVTISKKEGTVTTSTESLYDTCFFENNLLIEYFCNAKDEIDFEAFTCQNGCSSSGKSCEPQKQGVNLMPELAISPSEGLKSGDTIEVTLYIKNTGSEAATPLGIKRRSATTLSNAVYFYKDKEYGQEAISPIYATLDFLGLKDKAIQPGEAGKVLLAKQTVKIPEDFSGNLVIAAVVDAQLMYLEANEDDNRQSLSIPLTEKAAGLPNLVPTAVKVLPAIEKFPAEILSAFITVENQGEAAAVAEKQFLENKISILKGNDEICRGDRRDHATILPGKPAALQMSIKPIYSVGNCNLDDESANYWAVVEVDTLQTSPTGTKGVVTESNEGDNKQTFPLKGPTACSSLGAREAGKYCSIETRKWLTQKAEAQPCSHNFECQTELCIKQKCVSEAQKTDILKILGIS